MLWMVAFSLDSESGTITMGRQTAVCHSSDNQLNSCTEVVLQ